MPMCWTTLTWTLGEPPNPQCWMTRVHSTLLGWKANLFRSVNEKCRPNLGTAELSHNVSCPAHFLISVVNIAHENWILTSFYNSFWRHKGLSVWLQTSQEAIQVETSLDTAAVSGLRKWQIVWRCPVHVHYVTATLIFNFGTTGRVCYLKLWL